MKRVLLLTFALVTFLTIGSWAQERTISGKVTGEDNGSPVPGVNVILKGTTIGTVTDIDGNYKINVPSGSVTLVFSFIGLATEEVEIGSRSVIDMLMTADIKQLSEIVVTAIGIEREKKSLGYSVQDVSGEELTIAREQNIVNSLNGRIAGVQITNSSGAVGSSSRIILRGPTSIKGDNQPLFVVDGIPIDNSNRWGDTNMQYGGVDMGNAASDLNPDDIESISVLKGPNASALYGSRASNGVILITTKKGKGKKGIGVNFNANVTFENPLRLPDYQNKYGQGNGGNFEFVDGRGGGINDGVDESWGPRLDDGSSITQFFSKEDASGNLIPEPWVSNPDNVKDFFETGVSQSYNLSLTGNNENGNFRLSFTEFLQEGMLPNTNLERTTLNFAGGYQLTDKLSANASVSYIKKQSDNLPGLGYDGNNVMQQFVWFGRQVDISKLTDWQNTDGYEGSPLNWNYNYHNNPYYTLNENLNAVNRDRVIGMVNLTYDFTDWLSLTMRTGTDFYTDRQSRKRGVFDQDNPAGFYEEQTRWVEERNSDFLFSFNKNLNQDWMVSLGVGGQMRVNKFHRQILTAPELSLPGVYNLGNSAVAVQAENYQSEKRINSVYYTGQVGFRDYVFLDFTGRNDWSSTLPAETNSYFYPSLSLSWVISENFNLTSSTLSLLKMRASWAQVGSDTGPFNLYNIYSSRDPWGGTAQVTNPNSLKNPTLRPEISTSIELGLDVRLFENRVGLDVTYYDMESRDQIVPVDISGAAGYTSRYINAGLMTNTGIEALVDWKVVQAGDFNWDLMWNFARNQNKVVELYEDLETLRLGYQWSVNVEARVDNPYGVLFGPGFLRDSQGSVVHSNGKPVVDPVARVLGNVQPDFTTGLNNRFTWKGFDVSALIDWKSGGDLYSMTSTWGRYAGILEETLLGRENGIVGDGVMQVGTDGDGNPVYAENNVVVSAEAYNKAAFVNSVAEPSVFDASYVKLREVRIGYSFSKAQLGNALNSLSLSIVGRNLALLYSQVPHVDPETAFANGNGYQGIEFGQIPSARSVGFNINIGF